MGNKYTREQLNNLDKETLVTMLMVMQEQLIKQAMEVERLAETVALLTSRAFSKKSEKNLVDHDQLSMFDECINEAELTAEGHEHVEPGSDEVLVAEHKRKKRKGKREEDLSAYPVEVVEHTLSEEELQESFPEGYTRLKDEVYKKLELIPATFKVLEHHLAVYKGKNGVIAKAAHPKEMLSNSIATPSIVATIINAKYTNAVPIYRLSQEFERNQINISRQVMSNWVITTAERYISLIYDRVREELLKSDVMHADETPVLVTKDGREGMHKNYMWVYRSGDMCESKPAVIFDYQRSRNADAAKGMLEGFHGTLVCDGYQVYHTLGDKKETKFKVAGCWAHARRKFAEIVKSKAKADIMVPVASEAVVQIDNIYRADQSFKDFPPETRKDGRENVVKPIVDNFFQWCKRNQTSVPKNSATGKAINYCLNQEEYLRVFLTDPKIPLDNNVAERAIRPFCVGKKNWKLIDTVVGANASAILYSIVETAKANQLNIYQYLKHLLTEIPKHVDGSDLSFLDDLVPWSEALPSECRKESKDSVKSKK